MLKRTILMILLLACCLNLSACGPSRAKQAKNLKALFPEVKQFADDNKECLQTLLVIKDRIREYNEPREERMRIKQYVITTDENQVEFAARWCTLSPEEELSLITEEERELISETILKMSYEYRSCYITQDSITITYASYGNTTLGLDNPAEEIADPGVYPGEIDFTEPVNDDWCISVLNLYPTLFGG